MATKAHLANQAAVVRTYRNAKDYRSDAQEMARHGYHVVSLAEELEQYPLWKVLASGGFIYWLAPRHVVLVVRYSLWA